MSAIAEGNKRIGQQPWEAGTAATDSLLVVLRGLSLANLYAKTSPWPISGDDLALAKAGVIA